MKLRIDMNMSPIWLEVLRSHGIEAIHWSAIGHADAPDSQIMSFAAERGYAVFTKDLDFGQLLAQTNAEIPSVIQVRLGNLRPQVISDYIVDAMLRMKSDVERGAMITIEPERTRARVLPFRRP